MGTHRIQVTVCNVQANFTGDVVASLLSSYRKVEEVTQLHAAAGMAHGDYVFCICLNWEGFQSILDSMYSWDRQMIMVIEGRRLNCWNCKQLSHLAKPLESPKRKPAKHN